MNKKHLQWAWLNLQQLKVESSIVCLKEPRLILSSNKQSILPSSYMYARQIAQIVTNNTKKLKSLYVKYQRTKPKHTAPFYAPDTQSLLLL